MSCPMPSLVVPDPAKRPLLAGLTWPLDRWWWSSICPSPAAAVVHGRCALIWTTRTFRRKSLFLCPSSLSLFSFLRSVLKKAMFDEAAQSCVHVVFSTKFRNSVFSITIWLLLPENVQYLKDTMWFLTLSTWRCARLKRHCIFNTFYDVFLTHHTLCNIAKTLFGFLTLSTWRCAISQRHCFIFNTFYLKMCKIEKTLFDF